MIRLLALLSVLNMLHIYMPVFHLCTTAFGDMRVMLAHLLRA